MALQAPVACSRYPCRHRMPCPVHARRPFQGAHRAGRRVPAPLKAQVMAEEPACWICGKPGLPDDQPDHVTAVADGGRAVRDNLRRAHRACNLRRGASLGRRRQREA